MGQVINVNFGLRTTLNKVNETVRAVRTSNRISKTASKWLARINDTTTPWSESEIIYFRKAVGYCGLKNVDEREMLLTAFQKKCDAINGYMITEEQSLKGQHYLLTNTVKKSGQYRKGAKLGDRELDIMRNLSHHLFVGLYAEYNGAGEVMSYLPIYRAVSIMVSASFEYVGTRYEQLEVVA